MRSGIYTAYCSCVRSSVRANLIEKVGGEGCGVWVCNQAQFNLWVWGARWVYLKIGGVAMLGVCLVLRVCIYAHNYAGVCIIMHKMCVLLNSVQW